MDEPTMTATTTKTFRIKTHYRTANLPLGVAKWALGLDGKPERQGQYHQPPKAKP